MKTTHFTFLLFGLFTFNISIWAQEIKFTYDAAGNRISGKTIMILRSVVEQEEEDPAAFSEMIAEYTIRIYPNPTKGLLKIDVDNLMAGEKARIALYDISGKQIAVKEEVNNFTELDITSQPDGIYVLQISIGEYQSKWKVIKK